MCICMYTHIYGRDQGYNRGFDTCVYMYIYGSDQGYNRGFDQRYKRQKRRYKLRPI